MTPFGTASTLRASLATVISTSFPFGYGAYHGSPYIAVGRPERWADACRIQLKHDDDSHGYSPRIPGIGAGSCGSRERGQGRIGRCRRDSRGHAKSRIRFRRHSSPKAWSTGMPNRPPHWRPSARSLDIAQESGNRFRRVAHRRHSVAARGTARRIRNRPSTTSHWRYATTKIRATSRHRVARSPSSPPCLTDSDTTNPQPPSRSSPPTR